MPTILLSGCAIMRQGKILLIRKAGRDFWELPGGGAMTSDPEVSAVKKSAEQIGVEPVVVQQFTTLEFQKEGNNIEAAIFECDVDEDATFTPGEGIEEVKWHKISSLTDEKIGEDVRKILEEI